MHRKFHRSIVLGFLILLGVPGTGLPLAAQSDSTNSGRKVFSGGSADKRQPDLMRILEVAPLDIGESRGLYIVAPDGKMQMRILRSVCYLAYDHHWKDNLFSSLSNGIAGIEQYSFLPDDMFQQGSSLRLNTFWYLGEGAKLVEGLIRGQRFDKGSLQGEVFRVNLLVYYGF